MTSRLGSTEGVARGGFLDWVDDCTEAGTEISTCWWLVMWNVEVSLGGGTTPYAFLFDPIAVYLLRWTEKHLSLFEWICRNFLMALVWMP